MSEHKNLYIKFGNDYQNLENLILQGFSGHYAGYFQFTYLDHECTKEEDRQRRRSFDDLLVIARTYFPETTEEELAQVLTKTPRMRALFCRDIQKVVFVRDYDNDKNSFHVDLGSGTIDTKSASKYSAIDIYKLAGIEPPTNSFSKW